MPQHRLPNSAFVHIVDRLKAPGASRRDILKRGWLTHVFAPASALLVTALPPAARAQTVPAMPQQGAFVAGIGAISAATNGAMTVSQTSARGVIDWRSFSIGANGSVMIDNGAGATLNRVTGGDLSRIETAPARRLQ